MGYYLRHNLSVLKGSPQVPVRNQIEPDLVPIELLVFLHQNETSLTDLARCIIKAALPNVHDEAHMRYSTCTTA